MVYTSSESIHVWKLYIQFSSGKPCVWIAVDFPAAQMGKNLPAVCKTWMRSLGWEDPLEKGMAATPEFLPGESHGQRSLAGRSPRGHRESDALSR